MGEVMALSELTGNRGTSGGTEYGKRGPLKDFRLFKVKGNWQKKQAPTGAHIEGRVAEELGDPNKGSGSGGPGSIPGTTRKKK
jgi:hypothetical protein